MVEIPLRAPRTHLIPLTSVCVQFYFVACNIQPSVLCPSGPSLNGKGVGPRSQRTEQQTEESDG